MKETMVDVHESHMQLISEAQDQEPALLEIKNYL